MQQTTGRISIVQESRFRLTNETGHSELFVLHPSARLEPQDLIGLRARAARVTVCFSVKPGLMAAIVHDIFPVDGNGPAQEPSLPGATR